MDKLSENNTKTQIKLLGEINKKNEDIFSTVQAEASRVFQQVEHTAFKNVTEEQYNTIFSFLSKIQLGGNLSINNYVKEDVAERDLKKKILKSLQD